MRILIDLQGCQTASRYRGIGRYSLALARAIVRNRGGHKVTLLANGAFTEGLQSLKAEFQDQIEDCDFIVFDAELPVAEFDSGNAVRARLAELSRERLIATIAPDAVLLTSLFEGFVDDAVTSVGRIGAKPLTAVTVYDLIPYLRPDPNWPKEYKPYYRRKIESLKHADLFLSISDYARQEAGQTIPELADRLVNMSSACDPKFTPANVDGQRKAELFQRFRISGKFIMSAGNLEPRKNFAQILRSFAILPADLKQNRQIVLVGSGGDGIVDGTIDSLRQLASQLGLRQSQLQMTGHVADDDLLDLYRLCELFIFPSLHEGFGLPPLEAMASGAVVIGSSATSIPEVIGRDDATFDPTSVPQLRDLMIKALTDEDFRQSLRDHAIKQAAEFSWDKTAQRALRAIEARVAMRLNGEVRSQTLPETKGRPQVAMVCPLPPEQTGIADYLADLLPELGTRYDVTVVSDQPHVSPGPGGEVFKVKSVEWFEENATRFDRVVYQVGNSPFHVHMLDLLARHPGVVVLHDFFNSSLKLWEEATGYRPDAFKQSLLHSHGYGALAYLEREGAQAAKFRWPCSLDIVSGALGLIVHSKYSRDLVASQYGKSFVEKISVVPQHRALVTGTDRTASRNRLRVPEKTFLVCVFGFMDSTKLNHILLEAWAKSSLASDIDCRLVFVGGKGPPEYAQMIDRTIARIDGGARVAITGFAPHDVFADYLAAADMAVQLRTMSRGETSRTVLDCLAHGLPLVINANGSMNEYPDDVLIKLPDEFAVEELCDALENLRNDEDRRKRLSAIECTYIRDAHSPALTVRGYVDVVEGVVQSAECQRASRAMCAFWESLSPKLGNEHGRIVRTVTDLLIPPRRRVVYLDLSATVRNDLKTGIERVARALLREMLLAPLEGYQVVPVHLAQENGLWRVRQANSYLSRQPGFGLVPPTDELVIPAPGDVLMGLDLFSDGVVAAARQGLYAYWHAAGAKIGFMVYDLLPLSHSQYFPPWASDMHKAWTAAICANSDLLVCISETVKTDVAEWINANHPPTARVPNLLVSHLGADVAASFPTTGMPVDAEAVLGGLAGRPTFLMVGTIEPRKGHLQAVTAFERLWGGGVDVNLVIVGPEGWKALPAADRRTVPATVERIRNCAELGKRLLWLEGISDEYLSRVYAASSCLLAPSEGEGYGLPLIEAAQHKLPIIARDIPVFREVAGDGAYYFSGRAAEDLERAVKAWLELRQTGKLPNPSRVRWLTWRESTRQLLDILQRL